MHKLGVSINACTKAIELLSSIQGKMFFVQIQGTMTSLKESLSGLGEFSGEYAPIIAVLSQIKNMNKADPQAVARIITLITRLRATLMAEQNASVASENARQVKYKGDVARLTGLLKALKGAIRMLNKKIDQLETAIAANKSFIKTTVPLLHSAQANLKTETARCNELERVYNADTTVRRTELNVLNDLIAHFNKKVGNMSADLKQLTK